MSYIFDVYGNGVSGIIGSYSMKWTEYKKKFLELCDFNNMDINDVSIVKKYWERGYTVEETYEIWEDGV